MIETAHIINIKKILLREYSTNVLHFYAPLQFFIKFRLIANGIGTIVEQTANNLHHFVMFNDPPNDIIFRTSINLNCNYVHLSDKQSASFNDTQIMFFDLTDSDNFNLRFMEALSHAKLHPSGSKPNPNLDSNQLPKQIESVTISPLNRPIPKPRLIEKPIQIITSPSSSAKDAEVITLPSNKSIQEKPIPKTRSIPVPIQKSTDQVLQEKPLSQSLPLSNRPSIAPKPTLLPQRKAPPPPQRHRQSMDDSSTMNQNALNINALDVNAQLSQSLPTSGITTQRQKNSISSIIDSFDKKAKEPYYNELLNKLKNKSFDNMA